VAVVKVAVLATGGKDSALALYHVLKCGYDVKCLATMIPLREDSWMFHYPNIGLMDLWGEAVGLPVVKAETAGVKEEEVEDMKKLIAGLGVEGVVSGAIASDYQKARVERVCKELGLECIAPLWHKKPLDLLEELLDLRFEVVVTGVYAYGFDRKWLGRKLDAEAVTDLTELNRKYGISLVGEGGEYETLVLDAPFFKKKIKIVKARRIWKEQNGHYPISEAELQDR
jgi:predicted ATP pyrophosphatase (TIGR00289 family)